MAGEAALNFSRERFQDNFNRFLELSRNNRELGTNRAIHYLENLFRSLKNYSDNIEYIVKQHVENGKYTIQQINNEIKFLEEISRQSNNRQFENKIKQEIKDIKSILNLGSPNYNVSKITSLQRLVRAKRNVQSRYVNALKNDMRKEGNFDYYINKIDKVYRKIPEVLKHPRIKNHAHAIITTQIAPCHIKPGQDPVVYLRQLRNQLFYAVKLYHQKKVRDPEFSKTFFLRLKGELGSRPCLENLIEGLTVALSDPEFVWKGRSIKDPLVQNNARYLNILRNAVISFQEHHASNRTAPPLPLSLERRKKIFWNMIKNKNVFAVTRGPFGNNIGYTQVKKYNKNGNRFKASNAANLLEYIGRRNEGTVNFFRKKTAVKKIERIVIGLANKYAKRMTVENFWKQYNNKVVNEKNIDALVHRVAPVNRPAVRAKLVNKVLKQQENERIAAIRGANRRRGKRVMTPENFWKFYENKIHGIVNAKNININALANRVAPANRAAIRNKLVNKKRNALQEEQRIAAMLAAGRQRAGAKGKRKAAAPEPVAAPAAPRAKRVRVAAPAPIALQDRRNNRNARRARRNEIRK